MLVKSLWCFPLLCSCVCVCVCVCVAWDWVVSSVKTLWAQFAECLSQALSSAPGGMYGSKYPSLSSSLKPSYTYVLV